MDQRASWGFAALAMMGLGIAPASAAADGACNGFESLTSGPKLDLAVVAEGKGKLFFLKNPADQAGCPSSGLACRRKAFVLPGDHLIIAGRSGAYSCATFTNAKGDDTNGWLASDALRTVPAPAGTPLEQWSGTWTRVEAKLTIKPDAKRAGELKVHGDATWGALDPDRVKRGGVNLGEIDAVVAPKNNLLSFAMGDNGESLPVTSGDQYACRVWMEKLGPYLLVDDDNMCGGFNVSFRGIYMHR